MVVIVRETQKLKRKQVKRIKLEEVWLSVPCESYCKMDYINGEHRFRVKEDPLRKPIQGTEKGKQAEEADALVKKALMIIEYLARKKAEQLKTGVMMVVEGVEVDLSGMEWFLENPVGMLAMQDFMQQFEDEFEYEMQRTTIDYCAWGHHYQKNTHVWTSMVFWHSNTRRAQFFKVDVQTDCFFSLRSMRSPWPYAMLLNLSLQ